ncbi:MAG TPA: response regulator [Candidatus Dormibacteraeota bacterium]|nr:response regulator [Candidatus Dormibacteraeota bacterium]
MERTILAVDDSPSIRQMVAFTLKAEGYAVTEAADGEDALAKAKERAFSLVLTDQNMPKMDGLTLIRRLRELSTYRNTPILILTTESGTQMKEQGRDAGATGWLVKPFDPERLLEVVRKVL